MSTSTPGSAVRRLQQVYVEIPPSPLHSNRPNKHHTVSEIPFSSLDMTTLSTSPPQFLLHTFLRNSLFPNCEWKGVGFRSMPDDEYHPWPCYPELDRRSGTRTLREIKEIDLWDFKEVVRKHLDDSNDAFITEESASYIKLPCRGFADFEQEELDFFFHIDDRDNFRKVMLDNVLSTVCESTRIFINLPRAAPLAQGLRFEVANGLRKMPLNPNWDVLVMSQSTHGRIPFTVICAPPWTLSKGDLDDFARPLTITHNQLDTTVPEKSISSNMIVNTLWAVVHDVCHKCGRFFVVTNYRYWAFGQFSHDWKTVMITPPIETPLMDISTQGTLPTWLPYGFTVAEGLVYWIELARGAAAAGSL